MYCANCGKQIDDKAYICMNCGAATNNLTQQVSVDVNIINSKSRKNYWVTLILTILLGWLGFHRFYVGKIGTGILWMFSFGLLGIGVLYDLILIIGKDFCDSNDMPILP